MRGHNICVASSDPTNNRGLNEREFLVIVRNNRKTVIKHMM